MALEDDIRRLRRSIEEQQTTGHVDIADVISKLKRLESDARDQEDDAESLERKYKKLKRAGQ